MRKVILLVLLAGALQLMAGPRLVQAGTCTWSQYGGSCSGYGPGQNCTWSQYGGTCY